MCGVCGKYYRVEYITWMMYESVKLFFALSISTGNGEGKRTRKKGTSNLSHF